MGYRSQVAGCFSVDREERHDEQGKSYSYYDKAKFKEMVGFIKLSQFYQLWQVENTADANSFGWEDGYFVLYGDGWKWYPDYEDVKGWDKLWESMQNIEGISGYFVRVGEERDDVEEMEFGDDPCLHFFHTYSAISFDGNDFLGKRQTDDEEDQADQASTNPQKESCGGSVADSAQA
jgi:hypothetical protein